MDRNPDRGVRPAAAAPAVLQPSGASPNPGRGSRLPLTLACLALLSGSCAAIWDAANRGALESDVAELLGPAPAGGPSLTCHMIGDTRSGYCSGEISAEQAAGIAASLDLSPSSIDRKDPMTVPLPADEAELGCLSPKAWPQSAELKAWWASGRPASLELASGGQFEYLLLVIDPSTGAGCIQVSYAYG